MIVVDDTLKKRLEKKGVTAFWKPGMTLPVETSLEPPCSLKWMNISHSFSMGAFSYAVSGFYFACDIGRYCSFGENIQIGRHAHPMHYFSTSPYWYQKYENILEQDFGAGVKPFAPSDFRKLTPPVELQRTRIGHDVWIGHGALIMPGVSIGTGAVIGAMSVVTKDIPPYAVAVGSPARVVKMRFPENQVESLLELRWWEYAPGQLKGITADDIPKFLEHISSLRRQRIETYQPGYFELKELV